MGFYFRPLEPRSLSSGLAQRTLTNLDFIKKASSTEDIHPVTQVVNSLLSLLVFPVEKEREFFETFEGVQFEDPSDLEGIQAELIEHLSVPSLQITLFARCLNLSDFFKKIRNAVSHKHLEFAGDSDSRVLKAVTVTLKDRLPKPQAPFDWEISMTAEDLEHLSRFVAQKIIDASL
jgi:HEPN pEK499 p136